MDPGHPAWNMPPRPDDQIRRLKDTSRQQRENAAARSLESSEIASGELRVSGTGSIVLDGGTIDLTGSNIDAVNITASGDVEADNLVVNTDADITNDITVGNNADIGNDLIVGANADVTGELSVTGDVHADAGVYALDVYSHVVASSPRAVYVNSTDGRIGNIVSSRKFKQDIVDASEITTDSIENAEVVFFRYIQDVEDRGNSAEWVLGGIAEQFYDAGLYYLVHLDDDGNPLSIDDRALTYALLSSLQKYAKRIDKLENRLDSLGVGDVVTD